VGSGGCDPDLQLDRETVRETDYAIILLVTRLGLRASTSTAGFADFDWPK